MRVQFGWIILSFGLPFGTTRLGGCFCSHLTHMTYIPDKKKCIQYSLQNCKQLRSVDKIITFERNLMYGLSVIDNYLDLQYCMQNLFFLHWMYLLWALTEIHCLRRLSAVHLYQHMVYSFFAFPWRVLCVNSEDQSCKIVWTNNLQIAEENIWKQCSALLALMHLLAMPCIRCEQQKYVFFHYLRDRRRYLLLFVSPTSILIRLDH